MALSQVELRRRLWHQICYLDFRSAQEPTVADNDFTTLLPRNVNDEDLVEGAHPLETPSPGFADMTGHLIRLHGVHCFWRIVRSTYWLERRIKSSSFHGDGDLVAEFQSLFVEFRITVDEMAANFQTQFLQYCDPDIPGHRLALGLATVIEWHCWSIVWLRTPKQYRETVVSPDIRQTVFAKSVSLVESMTQIPNDKDAQKFSWYIGGYACFQAIMHIVT
ncbi:Transcription factor [Aspergillus sp. HF37]|nr:Transcription factor [Aspergillus sp. HF37]